MRIAVIGQGYVGLTASACLASQGHFVVGVESDEARFAALYRGAVPFYEPGLEELVREQIRLGRLSFRREYRPLADWADAAVIAVGSPQLPSGGADLRQVHAALASLATSDALPRLIIVKSTMPPGTSRQLVEAFDQVGLRSRYVYSPEFLSQGNAIEGWMRPSRIVVGLDDDALVPLVRQFYSGVDGPIEVASWTDAEMVKYASNAFLATKVSFINEIANLCDAVGADIETVAGAIGLDPRIGPHFLRAGVGYGGSCFPKDTSALVRLSNGMGTGTRLLEAVIDVNYHQRLRVVEMVRADLSGPSTIAVLGLAFKPGTDDLREAPSLVVVPEFLALGHDVRIWDPVVRPEAAARAMPGAIHADSIIEAARGARAVVVLTEWPELRAIDWTALADVAPGAVVIDGRNWLDPVAVTEAGFAYGGIGRGRRLPRATAVAPR